MTMTSTLIGRPAQKNWVLDQQSANTVESKQAPIQIPSLRYFILILTILFTLAKEVYKKDGSYLPPCNVVGGIWRSFGGATYWMLCNS